MNYLEKINDYITTDGTISLVLPVSKNDNQYLFTSTHFFICNLLGIQDVNTMLKFNAYIRKMQVKKGLHDVEPSWSERTLSHDEINGLTCYSKTLANNLYEYGVSNFWTYVNRPWKEVYESQKATTIIQKIKARLREYGKQNILRMLYLVPMIHVRAGKSVPFYHQWLYYLDVKSASKKPWGDTSTVCLYIIQAQHKNSFPNLMKKGMQLFLNKIAERYNDDLGEIYKIYFPNHPFAEAVKGISIKTLGDKKQ